MSRLSPIAGKAFRFTRQVAIRLHLVPLLRPVWRMLKRNTQRWGVLMAKAGLLDLRPAKTKVVRQVVNKEVKVEVEVMPRFIPPETPDIFVPIGQKLSLGESIYLPIILFDDTGSDAEDREELVHLVAQLQLVFHDFRPIFFTVSSQFAVFREYGYMVEYIMDQDRWARLDHELDWAQYRQERLNRIVVFHRVRRVLTLSSARTLMASLVSPLHWASAR